MRAPMPPRPARLREAVLDRIQALREYLQSPPLILFSGSVFMRLLLAALILVGAFSVGAVGAPLPSGACLRACSDQQTACQRPCTAQRKQCRNKDCTRDDRVCRRACSPTYRACITVCSTGYQACLAACRQR
jgi:hypothetical protein